MTEVLTAAQMRAIEQAAIESGEVTGLELMERAGQGVVEAIFAEWPELAAPKPSAPAAGGERGPAPSPLRGSPPEYLGQDDRVHRAVVLCGPGNNGGDGFVVARLLNEAGWAVEVFFCGDASSLPPDARVNYERWVEAGEVIRLGYPQADEQSSAAFIASASVLPELEDNPRCIDPKPFLLVDALFGIGLSRPISGLDEVCAHWDYITNFRDLNASRVVAVDIASGLDADSGLELREQEANPNPFSVLGANLTVSFHRMKLGHVLARGPVYCGKIHIVDLGF